MGTRFFVIQDNRRRRRCLQSDSSSSGLITGSSLIFIVVFPSIRVLATTPFQALHLAVQHSPCDCEIITSLLDSDNTNVLALNKPLMNIGITHDVTFTTLLLIANDDCAAAVVVASY